MPLAFDKPGRRADRQGNLISASRETCQRISRPYRGIETSGVTGGLVWVRAFGRCRCCLQIPALVSRDGWLRGEETV